MIDDELGGRLRALAHEATRLARAHVDSLTGDDKHMIASSGLAMALVEILVDLSLDTNGKLPSAEQLARMFCDAPVAAFAREVLARRGAQ